VPTVKLGIGGFEVTWLTDTFGLAVVIAAGVQVVNPKVESPDEISLGAKL